MVTLERLAASGGSFYLCHVRRSRFWSSDVKPKPYAQKNHHLDKRAGSLLGIAPDADDEDLLDTQGRGQLDRHHCPVAVDG